MSSYGARLARATVAGLFVALGALTPARAQTPFDLDTVSLRASKLASQPYREPKNQVPDWLLKISYDQWRDIRFRPDLALWADRPSAFRTQFFHAGLFYDKPIKVNVVEGSLVKPHEFNPNDFDYGHNDFASKVPPDLGYAGFRLHANFKTKDYFDEVIVFLGASYFRALGRDQVFGLSARGLAIDTADPRGEEFPRFTEFWLVSPVPRPREPANEKDKEKDKDKDKEKEKDKDKGHAKKDAKAAVPAPSSYPANPNESIIYALLDSPSAAGAFRFEITPGEQTVIKVAARIFPRTEVRKLGVAPLTSMFFHGEGTTRRFDDFRPEAHDSDGLQLALRNGEWVWRPLDNPKELRVSSFQMDNPVGFGLLQRDRNFDHYQDLETHAESRPSVWIEPDPGWGPGRVELVEIPTSSDFNDNVVSYWVPAVPVKPGAMLAYGYTMRWFGDDPALRPEGRAVATFRDSAGKEDVRRFVIDFEGKKLADIPADRVLHATVSVAGGAEAADVTEQQVVKNTATGGWRLTFKVLPKKRGPLDLRAFLDEKGEALTETWTYLIQP